MIFKHADIIRLAINNGRQLHIFRGYHSGLRRNVSNHSKIKMVKYTELVKYSIRCFFQIAPNGYCRHENVNALVHELLRPGKRFDSISYTLQCFSTTQIKGSGSKDDQKVNKNSEFIESTAQIQSAD